MRYIIVGAGGIGGAIGGRLADAGHEVVLVARGAHAAAMRADGLRLGLPERMIVVKPPVVEHVKDLSLHIGDVLMLCVKSQDTASLLAALAVLPVADAIAGELLPLICAQNGTSNEDEALRFFRHVHGMALMLQATHLEPGRVSASGSPFTGFMELGRYPFGSDEVDQEIAADLNGCGFGVRVREDVMAWKRAKLTRNLRNALEAMCGRGLPVEEEAKVERIRSLAMSEARDCFAAAGFSVVGPEEYGERQASMRVRQLPVGGQSRQGGSTWQSVVRGLGVVETDYLNGEIVRLGRLHGVPTPVNERIQVVMAAFVRRGGKAGSVAAADVWPDTAAVDQAPAKLAMAAR